MPIASPSTRCSLIRTGNAATVNLHISAASLCVGAATPISGISTDFDNDLRNPCTPDIGADEVTPYSGPSLAKVTISKTADAPVVASGSQIGFTVRLTNNSSFTATGLTFTDNLPAAPGVNWSIDAANTDAGWSVSGSPPSQSLVYSPDHAGWRHDDASARDQRHHYGYLWLYPQ